MELATGGHLLTALSAAGQQVHFLKGGSGWCFFMSMQLYR